MSRKPNEVPCVLAAALAREPRRLPAAIAQALLPEGLLLLADPPAEPSASVRTCDRSVITRPDTLPIGATVSLRVEVRFAALGSLLDGTWRFDPAIEISRVVVAVVTRLSPARWRVREALPLTPFGIWGPTLDLGDVVEIIGTGPRTRVLRGRESRGRPWAWRFPEVPQDLLDRPAVTRLLHELHEAGGSWVLVGDGLLVQFPRLPQETMPSPAASQRLSALRALLRG